MPTTYAIPDGRTVMAATLYTGTGATQSISNAVNGVSMQPDFLWVKYRNGTQNHYLQNSVAGVTNYLSSNSSDAENQYSYVGVSAVTAFTSSGFTLGADAIGMANTSSLAYVAWQWKAGGTAVSNTAGTITSQVSANTTAGFSVVTYTGTGVAATIGHGLGVAPSLIFVKRRTGGTGNWIVYSSAAGGSAYYLLLNTTDARQTAGGLFNSTDATSTVFSVGTPTDLNASASTYVAYCFAAVAGYSAFGSYTGNGSADGPFVYTGFRPRWILIKRTDTTSNWRILDTSRNTSNVENLELYPSLSNAEGTFSALDGLSNGFKTITNDSNYNASGGTYIYACFAETAFKFANAR